MLNSVNNKPAIDGITVSLLILLGLRFYFQIPLVFSPDSIIFLIFAGAYLISLIGVYQRAIYGPIIAMIMGISDALLAIILISDFNSALVFAILYDLAIIGFSYREFLVLNRNDPF